MLASHVAAATNTSPNTPRTVFLSIAFLPLAIPVWVRPKPSRPLKTTLTRIPGSQIQAENRLVKNGSGATSNRSAAVRSDRVADPRISR